MKKIISIFLMVISLSVYSNPINYLVGDEMPEHQKEARIKYARQTLKDYGLLGCLLNVDKNDSLLRINLQKLISEFSLFGNGKYILDQNEDTLEVIYNPYKSVYDYFDQNKKPYLSLNFEVGEIQSGACFRVYHSDEYQKFIDSQDPYIDPLFLSN